MSTEMKASASFTAFRNATSLRVILRDASGTDVAETDIGYKQGTAVVTIGKREIALSIESIDADADEITLSNDKGALYTLIRGKGQSYYCYIDPERSSVSMSTAAKLFEEGKLERLAKARAMARVEREGTLSVPGNKQLDLNDNDIPF